MKTKIIVLLSVFAALPQAQTGYSQGVTSAPDDQGNFDGFGFPALGNNG
jgi:hypothetical protein